MRLFFRKPKLQPPPALPNPFSLAINRWIDNKKRRIAAALSSTEQRLTVRQKKTALALFCSVGACLFLFNLCRSLAVDTSAARSHLEYMHLPAELPSDHSPPEHPRRLPHDTTSTNIPPDTIP
jgi:hypothetical protein